MSVIEKRVIFVGPADGAQDKPLNIEGVAVAAVAPGTTMKLTAAGLEASDIANTVIGEQFIVADKDQQRSKSVDDAWTIAENMVAIAPRSGEFVNVLVATAQTVLVGSKLTRNGAGLLILHTGVLDVVAYADEAVTTAATQLVRVRVA